MKNETLFTRDEFDKLVIAAVEGKPCTEKQLEKLYVWATETRIRQAILEKILSGTVAVTIGKGGEPKFQRHLTTLAPDQPSAVEKSARNSARVPSSESVSFKPAGR